MANHHNETPNSKGSIEVHAELKHAMVILGMLKRVLGGKSPFNGKAFASASLSTLQTSNTWIIQWKDQQQQMSRNVIICIPLCIVAYTLYEETYHWLFA